MALSVSLHPAETSRHGTTLALEVSETPRTGPDRLIHMGTDFRFVMSSLGCHEDQVHAARASAVYRIAAGRSPVGW